MNISCMLMKEIKNDMCLSNKTLSSILGIKEQSLSNRFNRGSSFKIEDFIKVVIYYDGRFDIRKIGDENLLNISLFDRENRIHMHRKFIITSEETE
ncbi:MAG: hypothetical protein SPK26_14955 [Treponema sp.]|nr:hypothetical protein [Treponema sp.]